MFKALFYSFSCAGFLIGACPTLATAKQAKPQQIILMIGDGMGPAITTAFRHYADDPKTPELDATLLDQLWVGKVKTHPVIDHSAVTDSAAGATALATGHKTHNFMLSQTPKHQDLTNWLEVAKAHNMQAGVVVTSPIAHATPAAFLTHHPDRFEYQTISDKIFAKPGADLILGGGNHYFSAKAEQALRQSGYQITRNYAELDQLKQLPALGVFGKYALQPALESKDPKRLTTMTQKALQLLEHSPKGFVLMIEGSQIDWAEHDNNILQAMHEMDDFVSAIAWVHAYVKKHPQALMVITADHGTGGISMGAHVPSKGHYRWYPEVLRQIKESPKSIAERCSKQPKAQLISCAELALHYPLTPEEAQGFQSAAQSATLKKAIKQSINSHSNTGWTTKGHTGEDVDIYAYGLGAKNFGGLQDNTQIGQKLIDLVKSP